MICRAPLRPIPLEPHTDDFRDAMQTGRCMAYNVDITGSNITIVCIYGWTGGHQDTEAVARTDDLFAIIRAELVLQPLGHKMIIGDISGESKDLANL